MSDDVEQKQHEGTSRHIDQMRELGQTLRSKDLSGGLILIMAIFVLLLMSNIIKSRFESNFTLAFTSIATVSSDPALLARVIRAIFVSNFVLLLPLFCVVILVPFGSVFILGGWNFSMKAVGFKWEKLSPVRNLSSIFSKRMFIDIGKSCLKFSVIFGIFLYFMNKNKEMIFSLAYGRIGASFTEIYFLMEHFILFIFLGIVLIILFDVIYSYFSYQKQTKMSSQELKDEHKQTEGNTDVKRKLRSMQLSIARQKINQAVPKATVVITNPTHYAVALLYDEKSDKAPKVVAKGKGMVAHHIRKLAVSNFVPIYEEPPLARAIFHTSKLNSYIHPGLYMAVAIVLTYINQVRRYQGGQGPLPKKAASIKLPDEFQFKA